MPAKKGVRRKYEKKTVTLIESGLRNGDHSRMRGRL